jgi:hypothetical protein
MKMRVQAQQLQPGDIVGSGETVKNIIIRSTKWSNDKCWIKLENNKGSLRGVLWGRYTMINITRPDGNMVTGFQVHEPKSWNGFSRK